MMNLQTLEQTLVLDGKAYAVFSSFFSDILHRLSLGYILLEYEYLAPMTWETLTPFEQSVAAGFSERRRRSFIASRIALKLLAHKMGLIDARHEAHTLETVSQNDWRPILPGRGPFNVSVAHDRSFVLAVADKRPIGVDIEVISPKLVRGANIFMNQEELAVVESSGLDKITGATMVWTAKEAAAKVLNQCLIDSWQAVRLAKLGVKKSIFTYGGSTLTAAHLFEWDRVVSLIWAGNI